MKKTLLGSVALLALATSAARAADLVVPAPARWTWSGFYVGGHIGSAMGFNTIANPLGPSIYGDRVHSPGYFGGGQIGVNWQAADSDLGGRPGGRCEPREPRRHQHLLRSVR